MQIKLIYADYLPVEIINYLKSRNLDFALHYLYDEFEFQPGTLAILILPYVYSAEHEGNIHKVILKSQNFCVLNRNSVFWIKKIQELGLGSKVFNYLDLKSLDAYLLQFLLPINLDRVNKLILYKGKSLALTEVEFNLVKCLYQHYGSLVTRADLMNQVWMYSQKVYSKTLDATVFNVRKKIEGAFLPKLIHTVYGLGYKLELYDG